MSFNSLNLSVGLTDRIRVLGFDRATPIQAKAIPLVLENRDILGLAQTGTGKTAAFILPILQKISENQMRKGIQALIVVPTRELAEQIEEATNSFGRNLPVRCLSLFGGVKIDNQIKRLQHQVDLVIACPGRLLDHINRKTIDLSTIKTLVLDEADQMLDMGFLKDIKKIIEVIPEKRQTLLFSATMPREIERFAKNIQRSPKRIQIEKQKVNRQIDHALYKVKNENKKALLKDVIKKAESSSMLVFTRTKHKARQLSKTLAKAGFKATALHGNLNINQRRKAVQGFKEKRFDVLVATDIAARGIDIKNISHVINFDVPTTSETYIHRLGRTGRAQKTGKALTFASNEEMKYIKQIEQKIKSRLPITEYSLAAI